MTKPVQSCAIILIPKPLRMEWTDVLALDCKLSHVAFRVACVIGSHFNKHSGDTYVSQETIARVMGLSGRTVWTAIADLERAGYLLIERRDLGVRASDGRRVCGGRGVANAYLPAFERSQVAATNNGRKLAARCDLSDGERSQNSVRKVAADCDPTLTYYPSGSKNPVGANCQADDAGALGRPGEHLRMMLGRDVFTSWFASVLIEETDERTVRLSCSTKFIKNRIENDYATTVLECWQKEQPGIERVVMVVRNSHAARSAAKAPA